MRALIWVLLLSQAFYGQAVRVRVINGNDGQPLSKQVVLVEFLYDEPTKGSVPLHIKTDDNGEARFSLPEPLPEHVDVSLSLTSEDWHCVCWVMTETGKVLHKGIMEIPPTRVPNAPFPPANAERERTTFRIESSHGISSLKIPSRSVFVRRWQLKGSITSSFGQTNLLRLPLPVNCWR
jgi:hypothetical protein